MSAEVGLAIVLKFLGSATGAALALVFVPPRTMAGFIRRLFAAMICGTVFATYVRGWVGFDNDGEGIISAACLTAFISWWAMGTAVRILRAWENSRLERDRDIDGQTD
jgi:hypothetical protein